MNKRSNVTVLVQAVINNPIENTRLWSIGGVVKKSIMVEFPKNITEEEYQEYVNEKIEEFFKTWQIQQSDVATAIENSPSLNQ